MPVTIRNARPEDAAFLAWVMQTASRSHLEFGILDVMFPGPEAQRLELLERVTTSEGIHYAHYSRFIVAEVDGQPAAALSAYENEEHGGDRLGIAIAQAFSALGRSTGDLLNLSDRLAPYTLLEYPNPDGRWIVEWVATGPDYRGRGLVGRLLETILERGRKDGFDTSQLGVLLGNASAIAAYERAGFSWEGDYTHPRHMEVFGVPGIARMTRSL